MHRMTNRRGLLLPISSFLPLFSRASRSQNTVTVPETASVLNKHLDWMEHDFVPAAEALPEETFFWVPKSGKCHGVRTFTGQSCV